MTQQHLNFEQREGCCQCGRTVNDDGSSVSWVCYSCGKLVCRHCTLTMPIEHENYSSYN